MHSTTCHHLFHSKCLLEALKRAWHCPVCRQPQPVYKPMRCSDECPLLDFYLSKEEMEHEQARHTPCQVPPRNRIHTVGDILFICDWDGCQHAYPSSAFLRRHQLSSHPRNNF
ncbi:RING finger protein [Sansalvadorimonas verongulae]|uniref:hypothetical protein n=1 Tax=Sansalvadorimonas verongulae TaxID=2172824 RepID=UPI0038B5F717